MTPTQAERMRWILFWVFLALFVVVSILTIGALFFGIGNLNERHEDKLMVAFIIEIGGAVVTLFLSLFGLKRQAATEAKQAIPKEATEANLKENVSVVTSNDAPLVKNVEISLNKPVVLDADNPVVPFAVGNTLVKDFHEHFTPEMMLYAAHDVDGDFRPNVVMQIIQNPLPLINLTLADYVKANVEVLRGIFRLKGTREIRASYDTALQWYSHDVPIPTKDDPNHVIALQQFQKYAVSGDRMGILTITYPTEGADNEHIRCLHELLSRFAVAPEGGEPGGNRLAEKK